MQSMRPRRRGAVNGNGLFAFVRLQRHLEEIIGCPVDLCTPGALRPEMRSAILAEAVYAA